MPYVSTNYCLCKHGKMLQVLILLILFFLTLQGPGHFDKGRRHL